MDKRLENGRFAIDAPLRDREIFFLLLMTLLMLSATNLYVNRDILKFYKYFCWATLTVALLVAGLRSHVRQLPTVGTTIAIIFGFVGCITVGTAQLSSGNSYGSALIPFLVSVLGYLSMGEGEMEVQRFVQLTYVVCGTIFIAGLIAPAEDFFRVNEFSFVLVFGLIFSVVSRGRLATVLILVVIAVSLFLRPTSTLFLGAFLGVGLAAVSARRPAVASMISCVVIFAFAIVAIASMSDPQLAYALGDIESYLKESILGGESNSSTRAALIHATQQKFEENSFFFGSFYIGGTNPDVSEILGRLDFTAPIHSDFVAILYQGGIVSLFAFCYFLVELTFLHRAPDTSTESDFLRRVVPACTAVFALYISFNPIMLNIEYSLWFFMLSFICLGLAPCSIKEDYCGSH
jgi:hypothetical protein